MSSQSSASLREEWELTEKSLSDLIAVGGQQQSRVALTALEAQLQRFQLWARVIGLPDDGVDNYLNLPKMESILYDCRRHIADAMQPGTSETATIWSSSDTLQELMEYFASIQQQLQLFLSHGQSEELEKITRELALELLWPDSPKELEYEEAAHRISMKESSKRLQELLSLIQSRRKLIDIEGADQSLSSLVGRAYVRQAANLGNLWDERTPATIGTWKAGIKRLVYVEWKDLSSEESSEQKDVVDQRIQDLGDVLSSTVGLNVLPFLAIIFQRVDQGVDQWGFVYELPERTTLDSKSQTMPSTLRSLLEEEFEPSLSARMHLALSLATSLLNFHLIGWLHKSIRSEHVMFFPEHPSQRSLRRPRWVRLTYARGDTEFDREFSERTASDELYCHPKYKQNSHQNFCRQYDYYALGALLLEIGQWEALDSICNSQIRSALDKDVNLLDTVKHGSDGKLLLSRLRHKAGDIYHDVVKTCLTGDFGVTEAAPVKEWHLAFLKAVVLELERCVV